MSGVLKLDLGTHTLSARRTGSGQSTIVCLHGFLESARAFEGLASELKSRWQVICLDHRGHGESGAPPGAPEWHDLAGDVAAALDVLDLERVTLVGHSLGGLVALHTALGWSGRIDHLVLIGTPPDISSSQSGWLRDVVEVGERDGLRGISRLVYGPETHREIAGDLAAILRVAGMIERGAGGVKRRLAEIACPTLSMVGSEDSMGVAAAERVARGVADGRLEVIEGQGHWPQRHAARTTASRIATFLSDSQRRVRTAS